MFCYANGWTQHSEAVQMIRSAAILQLLLGNVGRPGGGIMAMRGHASIRVARTSRPYMTCCPATCRCRNSRGSLYAQGVHRRRQGGPRVVVAF